MRGIVLLRCVSALNDEWLLVCVVAVGLGVADEMFTTIGTVDEAFGTRGKEYARVGRCGVAVACDFGGRN
jgi:hypothetical protein